MPSSEAKVSTMLDVLEQELLSASSTGAQPLQIMLAGALPMLRQVFVELGRTPGGVDGFLDGVLGLLVDLRDDDGAANLLVPGPGGGLYRVTAYDATQAALNGELVSVAGTSHRALGVREEHPGGVAALPGPGATPDS